MIQTSTEVKNLFSAFQDAQMAMKAVHKDASNPFFKSKYATLENVVEVIKSAFVERKLGFTQAPGALIDGALTVTTRIFHDSGEWMESDFQMPLAKKDPQGTGAAISYACRYALMAVCGLPATDDDAESATDRNDKKKEDSSSIISPAASVFDSAKIAAKRGNKSLDSFIVNLTKGDKTSLSLHGTELRKIADDADAMS